jgi:exosome complex component RRP42
MKMEPLRMVESPVESLGAYPCGLSFGWYTGPDSEREDSSPAAYSHFNSNAVEELSYDLTSLLQQTLSHPSLLPENLSILPKVKAWRLHLDAVVIADAGNVYDALFLAARAALWDTKVPRTRAVEYKPPAGRETGKAAVRTDDEGMDVDTAATSGFDTRRAAPITDFELLDYWDEGEPLAGREKWPLCVTMNLVSTPVVIRDD